MKPIGDMAAAHFNKIDLQHSVHLCALSHIYIYIYIYIHLIYKIYAHVTTL